LDNFRKITPEDLTLEEQKDVIRLATQIILGNFHAGKTLNSPELVRAELQVLLAGLKDEVFCMLYLDNRNRVLAFEELFRGTVNGASVHPRVVVRRALELNAVSGIMVHNHPSGVAEASIADKSMTRRLVAALDLIDVRIIDHFIVSDDSTLSFSESGYL